MNLDRKIRRALRERQTLPLNGALTLASAIWQAPPTHKSHAPSLSEIRKYIEAELEQRTQAPEFLALKRHLLICPSCATIYFDLLQITQLDERHDLPKPKDAARPDLSFLKPKDEDA